jgi:uncharacterized protein (TIGR03067 family)
MPRRTLAAVAILAASLGFAPGPVYRERPDELLGKMLGKWEAQKAYAHNNVTPILVVGKDTWAFSCGEVAGVESPTFPPWRSVLDSRSRPATIDLRTADGSGIWLRGIVKVEGDTLIFFYCVASKNDPTRPTSFDPGTRPANGKPLQILIHERVKCPPRPRGCGKSFGRACRQGTKPDAHVSKLRLSGSVRDERDRSPERRCVRSCGQLPS